MKSLLYPKSIIMSLCNHNDKNNINDLSKTSAFRNKSSFGNNPISSLNSLALCIGKSIGKSILKHKKDLATGLAVFTLPFIFTEKAEAVEGHVGIDYNITSIQGSNYGLYHYPGAEEGLDDYDGRYYEMHSPSGVSAKAVSSVESVELFADSRPPSDPPSGASVSLSIVTADDNPVYIPTGTTHWIDVSVSGYDGYKVYVNGEDMTNGGTINFGPIEGLHDDGSSTGSADITFESTTPPIVIYPPTISIKDTVSIGEESATLRGSVEDDGNAQGDEPCYYSFSYGIPGGSVETTSWAGPVYEGDDFSTFISGLNPETMYYFEAFAKNSAGQGSNTGSFTTLSPGSVNPEPTSELENILRIEHWEGQASRVWRLVSGEKETLSNTLDEKDQIYFLEDGSKIVSLIPENPEDPNNLDMYELKLDARKTIDGEILLEASSISSGEPKALTSENKLQLSLEDPNSTITIQPYDPNSPVQLAYDISTLTNNGTETGTIELFDPNDPEKTHAFFILNPKSRTAHWPLDETQGNIAEDKVNGYDGTIHGNPDREQGKIGGSLSLDGINDYVETPFVLDPNEGPFSAYAWIKGTENAIVNEYLLVKRYAGPIIYQQDGQSWLETDLEGRLTTGLTDDSQVGLTSQKSITNNEWHKVGIVWDGSKRYLYIDGEQAAKDTENINNLQGSEGGLYIGRNERRCFSGSIDDGIIYNIAVGGVPGKEAPKPKPTIIEGFEEGFGKNGWNTDTFNTGLGQWIITDKDPYSGNFCAEGSLNKRGNLYLSTDIQSNGGKISGYIKVSSPYRHGGALFIDSRSSDSHIASWGGDGNQDWQYFSYDVPKGNRKIIFRQTELDAGATGNFVRIDEVTLPLAE